ncbi:hypothetical protein [Prescottella equi]|uniref:hypothetical protein n=1 Tax=Rhodococcus hoagii TaxID=43767 RepID=UPI000A105709|nr:hypothetical protein [Prescottella equi]ORM08376.1 hypothetical protein A5N77_20085 [Prescottella equi]
MDYLRGNATASATGLYVICRHVAAYADGRTEDDVRRALQLLRNGPGATDEPAAVLTASLAVGEYLGVLQKDVASSTWHAEKSIIELLHAGGDSWPRFRGELLHRIASQGAAGGSSQGKTPDLVLGLTWFMQLNPLSPIPADWAKGPEPMVEALAFDAVSRSEQWRPFVRWAIALGVARRSDAATPKVVVPDASTAIRDQLAALPRLGSAREWLQALRARLPILGAPSLTVQLPKGGPRWDEVPPAVVLGLLKLERAGVLVMEPSDDAADVISMGLGAKTRQIGTIKVRSGRG